MRTERTKKSADSDAAVWLLPHRKKSRHFFGEKGEAGGPQSSSESLLPFPRVPGKRERARPKRGRLPFEVLATASPNLEPGTAAAIAAYI